MWSGRTASPLFFGLDFMEVPSHIAIRDRIRGIVEPSVADEGCALVAVELTGGDKGQTLRLFVDAPGGVTIDQCASISRALSPLLDVENPISGAYRLEVSSPGIDRPVETAADFARFVGFRAKVRLIPGAERRRYTGTLLGIVDDHVQISVDGETIELSLQEIDRARLVLELDEFIQLQSRLGAAPEPSTVTS
jgi:ribosome maturation factor RimP